MTLIYSQSVVMVYSTAASRYVRPARFLSIVTDEDITLLDAHNTSLDIQGPTTRARTR
jgi:hypothetical protein